MLRQAVLEIVENQLLDNTPPETRLTLERLQIDGLTREKAIDLIAAIVSVEIFDVLKSGKTYDKDRYIAGLTALPGLPFDQNG
jgi:hypothetical protein